MILKGGKVSEYLELSVQEKKQVIKSQLKNIQLNRYGLELNILQENSLPNPSEILLESFSNEMLQYSLKEQVLENKLNELNIQYPQIEEEI